MMDFGELEGADIILMRKAYAIVNVMNERDHMANFAWTLQLAEGTRAFHEVLERAVADGMKPGEFIAVHALAQCAVQLKNYPPGEHFAALSDFLFDVTKELLGQDMHDHVREWTDAAHADPAQLAGMERWAKLGAMTQSLSTLDSFSGFDAPFAVEHGDLLREAVGEHRAIAKACKGLSPLLDEYYESRLQDAEFLLRLQPPAAPSVGAPGPQ
jgi:hypothetical protein